MQKIITGLLLTLTAHAVSTGVNWSIPTTIATIAVSNTEVNKCLCGIALVACAHRITPSLVKKAGICAGLWFGLTYAPGVLQEYAHIELTLPSHTPLAAAACYAAGDLIGYGIEKATKHLINRNPGATIAQNAIVQEGENINRNLWP